MPLTFQGTWTIAVKVKSPQALPQRYTVSGATVGNGTYLGYVGAPSVTVSGGNWQLNIQANETYEQDGKWINSSMRTTAPVSLLDGSTRFDVESEDLVQDFSWDDLVLTLTSPPPPPPNVPPPPPPPPPPPSLPAPPPNVPTPPPSYPPREEPPVEIGVGRVYTRFTDGDVLPKQVITTTEGIWIDATGSRTGNLLTFFTSSNDTGSFKRTVFQTQWDSCPAVPQFDISYGHVAGSGSRDLGGYDWLTPSKAVYGQYRSLIGTDLKVNNKKLTHFYAVSVKRDRYGDRLDSGQIELNVAELSGSLFGNRNAHTGSNVKLSGTGKVISIISDAALNLNDLSTTAKTGYYSFVTSSACHRVTDGGPTYYMVSGSLEDGVYNPTNPTVYGLSYPNLGCVLIDGDMMDSQAGFLAVTGSDLAGDNYVKMLAAISGAALFTDASGDYKGFKARKVKNSYVEQYFVRVKNSEYNFTNNNTYVTGSEGQIIEDFYNKPKVYITTIGLHNDNHDLIAVCKLSKPVLKTPSEEALFTVAVNYE